MVDLYFLFVNYSLFIAKLDCYEHVLISSMVFQVLDYIKTQLPAEELENGQDPHKITEEIFHHEDKDRDGYISHEEFSGPKHDEL